MFCNVYFFYESETSYEDIYDVLKLQSKNYKIITNRSGLEEFLSQKGENVGMIDEIVPQNGPIAKEVYLNSRKLTDEYHKILGKLEFKKYQLTKGIDFQILRLFVILSKICKILDKKNNFIFIFEGIIPIYLSVLKYAKNIGYANTNLGFIKNKKIELFDKNISPNELYNNHKNRGKSAVNFFKLSSKNNFSKSNFKSISNFLITAVHFKINSFIASFINQNKKNNNSFLSKVWKKIEKVNNDAYNSKCLFFITASREDLYLRPWYPIFNELKNRKIEYMIFTSDFVTSLVLSRENLKFVNLFEEVNIFTDIIKKSEEGLKIIKEVETTIGNSKSVFDLNEISFNILKMVLRSVSMITILDSIMKNMNLDSIVACADGEHLENISIELAKKMEIASFSTLPAVIDPSPWFSDWLHSDYIFIHGQDGSDALLGLGYEKNRLLETGNPKFDRFNEYNSLDSKKTLEDKIGLNSTKKLVVIGMGRWHNDDEIWISDFIKFCNKNNFEIIIKIHPKYKIASNEISQKKIAKIKANCESLNFYFIYDFDLYTILSAADVVITEYSNVGIEAIIFDKPLITIDFAKDSERYPPFYRVVDCGASKFVQDYPGLENMIYRILKNDEHTSELKNGRKEIHEKYNYYNDGNASNRIVNYLLKLN